jgi:hypothetical protein
MQTFGASAPLKELLRDFGFDPERVVATAKEMLGTQVKLRSGSWISGIGAGQWQTNKII